MRFTARGVRETERPVSFIPKGALTHHLVVAKSVHLRFRLAAKTTLTPLLLLSPKSLMTFRGPHGRKSTLPTISKSADFSMGTGDAWG